MKAIILFFWFAIPVDHLNQDIVVNYDTATTLEECWEYQREFAEEHNNTVHSGCLEITPEMIKEPRYGKREGTKI